MEEACPLCGGELEEHDISDEREAELRENAPALDGKEMHATVCTACGHVSYHSE